MNIYEATSCSCIVPSQVVSITQTCSSSSALWMKRDNVTWQKQMTQRILGSHRQLVQPPHSRIRLQTPPPDCSAHKHLLSGGTEVLDCNTQMCASEVTRTGTRSGVSVRWKLHFGSLIHLPLVFKASAPEELRMKAHGYLLCIQLFALLSFILVSLYPLQWIHSEDYSCKNCQTV